MPENSAMLPVGSVLDSAQKPVDDAAWSGEKPSKPMLILVGALDGFEHLVLELGGDPFHILESSGINRCVLKQKDGAIPFDAMTLLLEHAAQTMDCPDFGMRLAERQNAFSSMKPLDRLICSAPTFGKATLSAIRHLDLYSKAIRESLEFDPDKDLFRLKFDFRTGKLLQTRQLAERTLLLVHNSTVHLTGGAARSREVWFSHSRLSSEDAYQKRFGATVKFQQEVNAVYFTGGDLRQKFPMSDEYVFKAEYEAIQGSYKQAGSDDVETMIRDFLIDHLADEKCTREDVADYFGMSNRSFHRRLSKNGWNFERLRDDVRRRLAIRYLARTDLSLAEVAAMVGYSELAVLSRSCRRWFCATPGQVRISLQKHE